MVWGEGEKGGEEKGCWEGRMGVVFWGEEEGGEERRRDRNRPTHRRINGLGVEEWERGLLGGRGEGEEGEGGGRRREREVVLGGWFAETEREEGEGRFFCW